MSHDLSPSSFRVFPFDVLKQPDTPLAASLEMTSSPFGGLEEAEFHISGECEDYWHYAGDQIHGSVDVIVPEKTPVSDIQLKYSCIGEVKWTEQPSSQQYTNGLYYAHHIYYEKRLDFSEDDITVVSHMDFVTKKVTIPFSFTIPKDKELPSTMICLHGSIQHFVKVSIWQGIGEPKQFLKFLNVQSPIGGNLMVTVGGSAEKFVLLHGGKVSMHASIGRKGFASGETITVHVGVDNRTNTKIVPKASLHQVQIYMSGLRHKTIESTLTEEPIVGEEINPHTEEEVLLDVPIPPGESLSIKSNTITIKYFVHVTLDIPHAFNLHLTLPVVITSQKMIEDIRERHNEQAELITENVRHHSEKEGILKFSSVHSPKSPPKFVHFV